MSKGQPGTFNNLPEDGSRKPIQIGNSFQASDATGTPQTSPVSYTNVTTTIVVPDRAAEFIIMPTTDIKISENSSFSGYDLIPANAKESVPCAGMSAIYITRVSGNGSAYFRFTLV